MNYDEFLTHKTQFNSDQGFSPIFMPDFLYDFQRDLVEWTVRKGRSALFADCGLGKTPMQLVWAENIVRKTNGRVLILTPLAVGRQTAKEGIKFDIECTRSTKGKLYPGITISNYERLHYFNPDDFVGVVCDECFAPDTPIDVFNIDNSLGLKYIKDISIGDKIYNAGGIDYVHNICKRSIDRAIQIKINGRRITCSENHPFFTVHGWKPAKNLQAGDYLMATEEAVRLVRNDFSTQIFSQQNGPILREVLLSEMENEYFGAQGKGTYPRSRSQKRKEKIRMVQEWQSESPERNRENIQFESDGKSRNSEKNDSNKNNERNPETVEGQKRRERKRTDDTSTNNGRGIVWKLANRISDIIRKKTKRIPNLLQSRFGKSQLKNCYRNRWNKPSHQEASRREEGRNDDIFRVESVEILEQGNIKLERFRNEAGIIYFYDIEAKRHPSFSVSKCLVHNSSILKNFDGVRRKAVTEFIRKMKYRLACTATAAPNDYIELGTTAEALGEMGYMDMLNRFFKNTQSTSDTRRSWGGGVPKWRFKKHAEKLFWRWVSSWSRILRKPSDMGFDDGPFVLTELIENQIIIKNQKPFPGELIIREAYGLQEQRSETKRTLTERCEMSAERINGNSISVAWCNLNVEGNLLTKLIDGAVQVTGSDSDDKKESILESFTRGEIKVLITKPKISGFGLNWQHCHHTTWFPSHSFEQYYQGIRRFWRFGQTKPVVVDVVTTQGGLSVLKNLQKKARKADKMFTALTQHMNNSLRIETDIRFEKETEVPRWL